MKILIALFFASFTLSTFAAETVLSCRCEDKHSYLDPAIKRGKLTTIGNTYRDAYDKALKVCADRIYDNRRGPISRQTAWVAAKLICSEPNVRGNSESLKTKLIQVRDLVDTNPNAAKARLEKILQTM